MGGGGIARTTVNADDGAKILTREQLLDTRFYQQVKHLFVDPAVKVIDPWMTDLEVDGSLITADSSQGVARLADLQKQWIDEIANTPDLGGTISNAEKLKSYREGMK